jgi:hypothetical protein
MNGFIAVDRKYVDAYAVVMIKECVAGTSNSELHLSSGLVCYSKQTPAECVEMVSNARAECEGRV